MSDSPPRRTSPRPAHPLRQRHGRIREAGHRHPLVLAAFLAACTALTGCTGGPPQVGGSAAPSSGPSSGPPPSGSTPSAPPPSAPGSASPARLPTPTVEGRLAAGLDVPWSIVALPDGSALVSERDTGKIKQVSQGRITEVGSIPEAAGAGGEGGLLGLAVTANFGADSQVYAYYTSDRDNRVVRMTFRDGRLGTPAAILTGIPKSNIHNGGRIRFGPDGYLYIGTGDAQQPQQAQDWGALGGKILRISADGSIPADNPRPGSPVYSLGHRNVQGLAWDSAGRLWESELGPTADDELNLIQAGGNYGWPEVTGAPGRAGFIDAKVVWPSTATASPSGMAIVDNVAYIAALRGERLWQVPLAGDTAGTPVAYFESTYGRLRDVAAAPGGGLWVVTNGSGTSGDILRIAVS